MRSRETHKFEQTSTDVIWRSLDVMRLLGLDSKIEIDIARITVWSLGELWKAKYEVSLQHYTYFSKEYVLYEQ